MTAARAPRGRPKGSGINDQHRLAEIARVIQDDPRIKPTTAIKALGITDPSTIRRLRDKFNGSTSGTSPSCGPAGVQGASRSAALKIAEAVKRSSAAPPAAEPVLGSGPGPTVEARPQHRDFPVAVALFGLGLSAATAFFEQQLLIAESVLRLAPVQNLIRSQIAVTEFMLDVTRPSPGSRYAH